MKTIQCNSLIIHGVERVVQQRDAKHDWRYVPGLLVSMAIEGNNYEDGWPKKKHQLFLEEEGARRLIALLQEQLAKIEEGKLSVGSGI